MHYIVLDLEWNQPMRREERITDPFPFDSEVIEFGAIRLDDQFRPQGEYRSYVRPSYYPKMNMHVAGLTRIRARDLAAAPAFPEAYRAFRDWCGDDCCFCTWGPDDIPVLMDNMLMYGLDTDDVPTCFDLQHIFAVEIMRQERQFSLEYAVELLGLEKDRSHDALNDVRNTVRVCSRMNLDEYIGDYALRYVGYAQDKRSGLSLGVPFPSLEEAMADGAMTALTCPYCGQALHLTNWVRHSNSALLSCAQCDEGDAYLGRFTCRTLRDGSVRVSRTVLELNEELWDVYQEDLEKAAEAENT